MGPCPGQASGGRSPGRPARRRLRYRGCRRRCAAGPGGWWRPPERWAQLIGGPGHQGQRGGRRRVGSPLGDRGLRPVHQQPARTQHRQHPLHAPNPTPRTMDSLQARPRRHAHPAAATGRGRPRRPTALDTLVQSDSSALHDLYFLSRRCLRGLLLSPTTAPAAIARPLAECHGGPPPADHLSTLPDAGRLAVSTAVAVRVSDSASPSGQAVFQWLMQTDRLTRPQADVRISSITRRLQPWQHASPELISRVIADADQDLRLDARLRYRSATGPRQPDLTDAEIQQRADKIPHALWPSWTRRLLPNTPTDPRTVDGFRRGCSVLLLLPGTRSQHYAWALPDNRKVVHNAFCRVIASADDETPIVSCLTQLADHLDDQGSPIDADASLPRRSRSTSTSTRGSAASRAGPAAEQIRPISSGGCSWASSSAPPPTVPRARTMPATTSATRSRRSYARS